MPATEQLLDSSQPPGRRKQKQSRVGAALAIVAWALIGVALIVPCVPFSAAAQDRSGVRPEVLERPSGPGSIEGLGESFEPNPNTGTSGYQVSIEVPPAVAGFGPELSLSYSSAGGNGEAGLNWSLGTPSVQRSTDRGLPPPTTTVKTFSSCAACRARALKSSSRWPTAATDSGSRARSRGHGFSPTAVGRSPTGADSSIGTRSAASHIEQGSRVFKWCLTEMEDTHGNLIRYHYEKGEGERPYLVEVVYNDFSPQVRNVVTLRYEGRPDPLTSYLGRFRSAAPSGSPP